MSTQLPELYREDLAAMAEYLSVTMADDSVPERTSGGAPRQRWADYHRSLIAAMEPAQWPEARVGTAQFTDAEVREIRETYARGELSTYQLGETFCCNHTVIGAIVRGEFYKDAGGLITHRGHGNHPPNRASA